MRLEDKKMKNKGQEDPQLEKQLEDLCRTLDFIREKQTDLEFQELTEKEQILLIEELKVDRYMIQLKLSCEGQKGQEELQAFTEKWELMELIENYLEDLYKASGNGFGEQVASSLKLWCELSAPDTLTSKNLPTHKLPLKDIVQIIENFNWRVYDIDKAVKSLQSQRLYENSCFWLVEFLIRNCGINYPVLRDIYDFICKTSPERSYFSGPILKFIYLGVGWKIELEQNHSHFEYTKRWTGVEFEQFVQQFSKEIKEHITEYDQQNQKYIKDFLQFLCYKKKVKLPNLDQNQRQPLHGVQSYGPLQQSVRNQRREQEEKKDEEIEEPRQEGFSLGRPNISPPMNQHSIFDDSAKRPRSTESRTGNTSRAFPSTAEHTRTPFFQS